MGQIRDIMEKDVITIEKDKTAQDAAKILGNRYQDKLQEHLRGKGIHMKRKSK